MPCSKPTLLIVDDEEGIHRALERTLRREPLELLHAYDAGEAEAILRQRPVHAVICDHYMPGTPGLEFLLHLRRTRPEVVAILLTAQADLQMVITAMNEGHLHRFFTKPWDGNELRGALRELLRLPGGDVVEAADRERAREEQLVRSMAPQRDADGAWIIDPPAGG
ncbi:MAG: response regulator [Planctomycetes bacterium]|nr:response regulator [Planctomycetota bacterium]